MILELVHACSICNKPIHMDPELVQACTNLKRDSYMSPLQFIILLVRGLANIPYIYLLHVPHVRLAECRLRH